MKGNVEGDDVELKSVKNGLITPVMTQTAKSLLVYDFS